MIYFLFYRIKKNRNLLKDKECFGLKQGSVFIKLIKTIIKNRFFLLMEFYFLVLKLCLCLFVVLIKLHFIYYASYPK